MRCQDIYGSTESTRVDGTGVSALLTWDSKVTTVNAILGGVTNFVRQKMKADNVYNEFVNTVGVCNSTTTPNETLIIDATSYANCFK